MAAYWIGAHEIIDPVVFQDYLRQVVPLIERFGGRYLTKTGRIQILEKAAWRPDRVVIVEFPDRASLDAWYHSPEYQPLIALRQRSCRDLLVVLESVA
jgi:uncharacterized protein (DUF1330 family)